MQLLLIPESRTLTDGTAVGTPFERRETEAPPSAVGVGISLKPWRQRGERTLAEGASERL
jgi:hypothetical protein